MVAHIARNSSLYRSRHNARNGRKTPVFKWQSDPNSKKQRKRWNFNTCEPSPKWSPKFTVPDRSTSAKTENPHIYNRFKHHTYLTKNLANNLARFFFCICILYMTLHLFYPIIFKISSFFKPSHLRIKYANRNTTGLQNLRIHARQHSCACHIGCFGHV